MSKDIKALNARLLVDGEAQEPSKSYRVMSEDADCPSPSSIYSYYEVTIDNFVMKFYVSYSSVVEVQTKQIEEAMKEWPNLFIMGQSKIVVLHSNLINCVFTGNVSIEGTDISDSYISDTTIENIEESLKKNSRVAYEEMKFIRSSIRDSLLSRKGVFEASVIRNVRIKVITPYTEEDEYLESIGLDSKYNYPANSFMPYSVFSSTIIDSILNGYGQTIISGSYACDLDIEYHGFLNFQLQRLSDVAVIAPSLNLSTKLSLFRLDLPLMTLFVFETKDGDLCVTEHKYENQGPPCFLLSDPDFESKLSKFVNYPHIGYLDSIMEFIMDSIRSRIKVLAIVKEEMNLE